MVAGYVLRARLGAGGMGRVYLSFTPGGRAIAIKVVRPEFAQDPEFRWRFRQETEIAKRVQGIYTAPVVDSAPDAEVPWLATAYVPGPSLQEAVTEHGPMPLPTVFRLLGGVGEALGTIHAAKLVHRDLKPANVLLADDGPRVIDFGIARAAESTLATSAGVRVGTPAYMAPEQIRNLEITQATDVFALGQLALFAATGHTAFGEGVASVLFYRIVNEPPDLDGCPEILAELLERCLSKDPAERPTTAEIVEFAAEQMAGQTMNPVSWLPPTVATSLSAYATSAVAQPTPPPEPTYGYPSPQVSYPVTTPARHPAHWPDGAPPRRRNSSPLLVVAAMAATSVVLLTAILAITLSRDDSPSAPVAQLPTNPAEISATASEPTPDDPPPTTAGPSAAPLDPGDIPRSFLGTWSGNVSQPDAADYRKYPVELTLHGGDLGDLVGESHYGLLNCSGQLTLTDFAKSQIEVEEKIIDDPDSRCVDVRITLKITGTGLISYSFRDGAGTAILRKGAT